MKYIRADLLMNKIAESAFFSAAEKGKIRAAIEKELGEDVKPVVHAHWELSPADTAYDNVWICSNCGEDFIRHRKPNFIYCPNCGAKMDDEV